MTDRPEYTLLGTNDAKIWAEEFCRIFDGFMIVYPGEAEAPQDVDQDTMVTWFANAMQTAVNMYERRALSAKDLVEEVEEVEIFDQDEDLTLEESFMEGFQEGREDGEG